MHQMGNTEQLSGPNPGWSAQHTRFAVLSNLDLSRVPLNHPYVSYMWHMDESYALTCLNVVPILMKDRFDNFVLWLLSTHTCDCCWTLAPPIMNHKASREMGRKRKIEACLVVFVKFPLIVLWQGSIYFRCLKAVSYYWFMLHVATEKEKTWGESTRTGPTRQTSHS